MGAYVERINEEKKDVQAKTCHNYEKRMVIGEKHKSPQLTNKSSLCFIYLLVVYSPAFQRVTL